MKRFLGTPTFALSICGYLALIASWIGVRRADALAFVLLGLAGAGTAMALGGEVRAKGESWCWKGLYRALRRPSLNFWAGFLTHLPQLLTSTAIAINWRRERNGT